VLEIQQINRERAKAREVDYATKARAHEKKEGGVDQKRAI